MPAILLLLIATLIISQAQDDFDQKYQTLLTELNAASFENRDKAHKNIEALALTNPKIAATTLLQTSEKHQNPETRLRTASILHKLYTQKFTPPAPGYLGIRHGQAEIKIDGKRVNAALVLTVMPNTPAAKAGLKIGDTIIELAGKDLTQVPIRNMRDILSTTIKSKKSGETIKLTIWRNAQKVHLKATLAPYIDQYASPQKLEKDYQNWLDSLKEK